MLTREHTQPSSTESSGQAPRGTPVTGPDAREQLLAWMPVTERRLELAGVSTAILEAGAGPPVILLHGPFAHAGHWLRVIPDLAQTHRVIAPDLPGHGSSRATESALTVEGVLAWLGELIAQTCEAPPALVGQTLGGAIAARFAIGHGARVSRLVLIDSFGLAPLELPSDFAQALSDYVAQPTEGTHEGLWRFCAFDLELLRRRMGARWDSFTAYNLQLARTPSVRAAANTLMERFASLIPADALARIAVHTTLAWGRCDLAIPLAAAQAVGTRLKWPLHVIEDSADDPPVEQPEAIVRLLRTILAQSQPERATETSHA